jgi:DNA-directed RNA polymerase omega subunit
MGFVPVEKLTDAIENKYEAILVAAKDARIQNSMNQLREMDPDATQPKMTSQALQRVIDGQVNYSYEEDAAAEEASDAKEGTESKDE